MDSAWKTTAILLPLTTALAYLVNREVPDPYLDEIFHIPQAQQYCRGEFLKWDSSITTPPGLSCNPSFLRYTNVLLSTTLLTWSITGILRHTTSRPRARDVLAISPFPLVTFFSLLYYTDVGSLTFVLVGYWAARERRYGVSALAGLASLTFRQTNIVWVAFTAATSILSEYSARPKPLLEIASPSGLVTELVQTPWNIITRPRRAGEIIAWYVPTIAAFGAFVIWNGGIVLGHQEMHVATIHFPQLLYFLAFSTIIGWPVLCDEGVERVVRGTLRTGLGSRLIEHPFLLADNRHYFFYIWRRIFRLHAIMPYALTPGYLVCGWAWLWKIGRRQDVYWIVGFVACTAAVLVPTPLVEPRYFLIPYLLLRLHCGPLPGTGRVSAEGSPSSRGSGAGRGEGRAKWAWVEIAWNAFVNAVTIGVFLAVTFEWKGWEGKMRFMW
ncbi:hypothetical protein QFC20_002601 [Naganishia adeliensis]|uniref:Uncharacterized protein n=1 Tax=Naganishia adeliensis TaxID=92952 RepID=A0ACC2WHR6_9TREE|nr:hypothetical protein QFC20_002601 [Naganishia adeliensis]